MLKKSFKLCPNKNLKKQSVSVKLKGPSKKLVTTIVNPTFDSFYYSKNKTENTNIALPSLGKEKKGIRTYSSYASPFSSRYTKRGTDVRYLSQKVIKPTVYNSSIRKVPSVHSITNITLPTVKNNNLSIIRSGEKNIVFSGAPNLVITKSNSKKNIVNPNNRHGINKLEQNIKKLRKNVEMLQNNLKNTKSKILYPFFSSKNNKIIFSYVKKGFNKNADSKNISGFGKHPFNKKIPGQFKRANKGVRLFTPKSYYINKIRY